MAAITINLTAQNIGLAFIITSAVLLLPVMKKLLFVLPRLLPVLIRPARIAFHRVRTNPFPIATGFGIAMLAAGIVLLQHGTLVYDFFTREYGSSFPRQVSSDIAGALTFALVGVVTGTVFTVLVDEKL